MAYLYERRYRWSRLVGLERRGAPLKTLMGHPLPDPTRLLDEDFQAQITQNEGEPGRTRTPLPWRPGKDQR